MNTNTKMAIQGQRIAKIMGKSFPEHMHKYSTNKSSFKQHKQQD